MELLEEFFRCKGLSGGHWADSRFALPGAKPQYAPDRPLDTRHIRLDLTLKLTQKSLAGSCTTTLAAIDDHVTSMVFDAVNFKDVRVSSPDRAVRHAYDGRKLQVTWSKPLPRGQSITIAVRYRVTKPKLGVYFVGPDRYNRSKPVQVWTQGEDEYNRFWFPCHDAPQERATTEVRITVPKGYTAVSNGALVRTAHNRRSGITTFHWKQNVPHAPYLVSFAVGKFSVIRDLWRKVPVLYFCPTGREDDARRAFGKTPKMMEFFSKSLGVPYPYAKYAQVAAVDFVYGGMENTSATTQTALTLHDARAHLDFSSDPLVAHELAHQWFGDLVTCKDWSHAWLNESFATYLEALFKEHDLGYDEFIYQIYQNSQAYFEEDKERYRRPLVTHIFKGPHDLFDRHLYEKGSVVLHMLRGLLGDRSFWRSLNLYLRRHRAQTVETVDLVNAIQDATGKNVRPFFDQWVFKAGHPEYKVRFWWDARTKKIFLRVLQIQSVNDETPLFSAPIGFAFHTAKGVLRFTETIDKKDQLLSFRLSSPPTLVLFDPDHWILKKVDIAKPEEMWLEQLTQDPHVLGRLEAAQVLGRLATPRAVRALANALLKEKFWGTQAGMAQALGSARSMDAMEALLIGLREVTHPKSRRAIFEALGRYSHPRVVREVQTLCSTEKSYFAEGEATRTLGRMRDPSLLGLLKGMLRRESWNDVLRCASLEGIAAMRLPESVQILKSFTRSPHSHNARMTAARCLASFGQGQEKIQKHLVGLLKDPFLLVKLTAVRALGAFADERVTLALRKYTSGDLDGRLKRVAEETIRKIRKGMEQEISIKTQ